MKKQDYSNHARLVPGFHGFTFLGLIALLIGSIVNVVKSSHENLYSASLLVLTSILLILLAFYMRGFALKARQSHQSRGKLQIFFTCPKALPKELTIRQIIGLRFASDEEFLTLVDRAIKENLSEKEIKKAIKNWKGDYYRV